MCVSVKCDQTGYGAPGGAGSDRDRMRNGCQSDTQMRREAVDQCMDYGTDVQTTTTVSSLFYCFLL